MLPLPNKPAFNLADPAQYWINAAQTYNGLRGCGAGNALTIGAMANADMEAAMNPTAIGDKDTAFNLWQWHWEPRGVFILARTGVDVRSERSIKKICGALWFELNNVRAYATGFRSMKAANTAAMAARIFCTTIEGAGAADAADRRALDADFWVTWVSKFPQFIAAHPAQ